MPSGSVDISGEPETRATPEAKPQPTPPSPESWFPFIAKSSEAEVRVRLESEIGDVTSKYETDLANYCVLCLYDPHDQISSWDSNRIYSALREGNANRDKDVLLIIVSPGGAIEPAYQISKICKAFSREKFEVLIPRAAKSAATLIALGADHIHMGILGELGPIDPQLGDLPALGVKRALETIAKVAQEYPGSADMFARYMARKISIEQIGYSERVVDSAVQYAERLLGKKEALRTRAAKIASQLVKGYEDHGFVIDVEESKMHFGENIIVTDSPELRFGEEIFLKLDQVNLGLNAIKDMRLSVVGGLRTGCYIYSKPS